MEIKEIKRKLQTTINDTLVIHKYNLAEYKGGHIHRLDNMRLLSVTTFTNSLFPKFDAVAVSESCSTNKASKYYGLTPEFIRGVWNSRAVLGNKKHKQIERWLKSQISDLQDSTWFLENDFTPNNTLSEVSVFSKPLLMGGIADLVKVEIGETGKPLLKVYDIKTSSNIENDYDKLKSYSFQIYLYVGMLRWMLGDSVEVKAGSIIHIEPKINEEKVEPMDLHNLESFYRPTEIEILKDVWTKSELKSHLKKRQIEVNKQIEGGILIDKLVENQ